MKQNLRYISAFFSGILIIVVTIHLPSTQTMEKVALIVLLVAGSLSLLGELLNYKKEVSWLRLRAFSCLCFLVGGIGVLIIGDSPIFFVPHYTILIVTAIAAISRLWAEIIQWIENEYERDLQKLAES